MLFKEAGYDEFLVQKIKQGIEDLENGNYVTAEQFKREIELLLTNKEKQFNSK